MPVRDVPKLSNRRVGAGLRARVPGPRLAVAALLRRGVAESKPASFFPDGTWVVPADACQPSPGGLAVAGCERGAAHPVLGPVVLGKGAVIDELCDLAKRLGRRARPGGPPE